MSEFGQPLLQIVGQQRHAQKVFRSTVVMRTPRLALRRVPLIDREVAPSHPRKCDKADLLFDVQGVDEFLDFLGKCSDW